MKKTGFAQTKPKLKINVNVKKWMTFFRILLSANNK